MRVSCRSNVGCKATAAVYFLPAFCPVASTIGLQTGQQLPSLGPPFASTPPAAHAFRQALGCEPIRASQLQLHRSPWPDPKARTENLT